MKIFALFILLIAFVGASFAPRDVLGKLSNTHIVSDLTNLHEECNILKKNVNPMKSLPNINGLKTVLPMDGTYHIVMCPSGIHPGPSKVNLHNTRN